MTRSIAVFCGARPVKEVYMNDAYEVGKLIAERTHTLVYGGGANGLMGKVYEGASEGGGKIVWVIPRFLIGHQKEWVIDPTKAEIIEVATMDERKKIIFDRSDTVLMLPGWVGTLDEFFEAMSLVQLWQINHQLGILNTAGFYDELISQINKMTEGGFLPQKSQDWLFIEETPAALFSKMNL